PMQKSAAIGLRSSKIPTLKLALVLGFVLALLDGGLEDIAQRGARVGRAILCHSLLLLGELELLDGHRNPAAGLIDADHGRIDLIADVEALRALLCPIA